jgi:small conductance mechanosensitive channel
MVRYAIIIFTLLAVAVIGAAGLAIGLALQGTLSNISAGVMLLIFRPFKVGDFIDNGGVVGTVTDLSQFAT